MIRVLFAAPDRTWSAYRDALSAAFDDAGLDVDLSRDHAPGAVDYIVYAPSGPLKDFAPFSRLKAVLNLWAGVEDVVGNATLKVPLARMVDPGLTEGMVEWVTGHVLRHHLGIDFALAHQSGEWVRHVPPLARDREVGILGAGALGRACAEALRDLRFSVGCWSRRPHDVPGVRCLSGSDGLDTLIGQSEILVLLLPLTPLTRNVMNGDRIARLPRGAVIVNPGRGALIDDDRLLEALDSGHVGHATLDVFRTEPLPPEHPFWAHPRVTVTPHIASETRPRSAARVIAENIRRGEAGEPFLHLVDRNAGY